MAEVDVAALERTARRVRSEIVRMSHDGRAPHLGSSLSCADILVAAYFGAMHIDPSQPEDPSRDRFVLSKGHAAPALYATLAHRGFFPIDWLRAYNEDGGKLAEHPAPRCVPGVEAATGSLGHGLPIGIGMAMAAHIRGEDYRVFVTVSDGECNEGSVWEAAMFAPAKGLDNLAVIVDYNRWQATGRSAEVMAIDPLKEKWASFGWQAHDVDGHDLGALSELLGKVPDGNGKPVAIVAHTTKGRGVSFMEDDNNWHYRIPNEAELERALGEIGAD